VLVILSRLIRSVAVPYVVLCASVPLLQAWFAAARTSRAPYRLFALSNAGSMLALLSYPFVVEPWLTSRSQEIVWSWAFGCFALLCALCVRERWNASGGSASEATPSAVATHGAATGGAPGQRSRLLWLALPACASTLLLAVTNQICQEIAVVPLLWVLPLGLYLLSFILCFESERWYSRSWCLPLLVLTLAVMAQAATLGARAGIAYALPVDSIGLFVCCMFCHGELAARRPPQRHLTSFFLHVALGGALGGVFVSLLAPMLFEGFDELYVGLLACGALALAFAASSPAYRSRGRGRWHPLVPALALVVGVIGLLLGARLTSRTPPGSSELRNFYGILRVQDLPAPDGVGHVRYLTHGGTRHGQQFLDTERRTRPTTYYGSTSGIGILLDDWPRPGRRLGIVGLGASWPRTDERGTSAVSTRSTR
jgi:hypothetical protein